MIHFDQNADIVIKTLEKYQYSPDVIKLDSRCFYQLKHFMEKEGLLKFDLNTSQRWCEGNTAKTAKRPFSYALLRLADVYEHGRVLSSHLTIHGDISDEFSDAIDSFIVSISQKGFIDSSFVRYRECCLMFFRFCQINGVKSLDKIDFPILEQFHAFIAESGRFEACEGCTERMLWYLAETRGMKYGFSFYLHYARFERCSSIDNLSPKGREAIGILKTKKGTISSREFCASIASFIDRVRDYKYASNTVHAHYYHLSVFGIFLEHENLDYSRHAADVWGDDVCDRFFGKTRLKSFRHTIDLYDTFISSNYHVPKSVHAPRKSTYQTLPEWCKTAIEFYAATRKKEGLRETTVRKQVYTCAKFCGFVIAGGLASFSELRAEHIKMFNQQDKHKSVSGKNHTNQVIYRFLIHMELHGVIQAGLHDALPCCTAHSERIVTVLSDEEKDKISLYCNRAKSPIELRDAAMIKLGINTAFRGVDIISLRIKDINWRDRYIKIVQQKTGKEHIHPVDTGTLNAVFRYISEGRPKSVDSGMVFISSRAPYSPLSDSEGCRNALRRIGICVADFHRLRRSYATDSLKGGATFRETAELLGHSDTGTVHRYTLLDDNRMRLCPLSLEETGLGMDGRYHCE